MKTTIEFIADLKAHTGLDSDYAIAKLLGVTKNALSLYRNGKSYFGDEVAMKVADLLNLDAAYVVACVHAERAKHEGERKLWERIATLAAGVTVSLAVMAALPFVPMDAASSSIKTVAQVADLERCILCQIKMPYWRGRFAPSFHPSITNARPAPFPV